MSDQIEFFTEFDRLVCEAGCENPTVEMVEAAYRHHGLHWRYINTEVGPANLSAAVAGARAMNWAGFNCSLPNKVEVIQHIDGLGNSASVIGAVNCVVRRGDQLIGENTDGKGFLKSLEEIVDPAGKRIVMFGAGGAARAIGVEVALAGATHITIVNRSEERGNELVALLNDKTSAEAVFEKWDGDYSVGNGVDVVINGHIDRAVPGCRCPAGAQSRFTDRRHGGGGRDPEPAPDKPDQGRRDARLQGARRPRHVGESGHHRHRVLDRRDGGWRRDARPA